MTNLAKSGPENFFCKLIFRSTDLQMGQTERANVLNKSINGGRRPMYLKVIGGCGRLFLVVRTMWAL